MLKAYGYIYSNVDLQNNKELGASHAKLPKTITPNPRANNIFFLEDSIWRACKKYHLFKSYGT